MGDYRRLVAWQVAYELVLDIYRVTAGFPDSERFGLTSQLRRGSVSVVSNIAEGAGRGSQAELRRFAAISLGALHELTTQLSLTRDLGFTAELDTKKLLCAANRVGRLLRGLARRE